LAQKNPWHTGGTLSIKTAQQNPKGLFVKITAVF